MRVFCTSEQHANGGPGEFILARTEDALKDLLASYRNRVQVIYLDPPFGTGDVFHSTRGGCGALCTRPGHACVGCRGPANPYLNKDPKFVLDNLRRVFSRMTDIPAEEIDAALESPWLSLFLGQFTDYTQETDGPRRTKEKML